MLHHARRIAVATAEILHSLLETMRATRRLSTSPRFITTNCDNCALTSNNITAWAFKSAADQVSVASSVAGAQLYWQGNALDVTPTAITFGFSPAPTDGSGPFYPLDLLCPQIVGV
jgi:hypothetical protein